MFIVHFDTGRSWRGGQNQVFLLIKGLAQMDIRQLLITPAGSEFAKKEFPDGVEIGNIDPVNDMDFIAGLRLKSILKKTAPDIVHFHTSKALGIGAFFQRKGNYKTVYTRRVDIPVYRNFVNFFKYGYPDVVVAISGFIESQMADLGIRKIERIYSSVEIPQKAEKRADDKQNSVVKIGMSGALDLKHKDYVTFLEAASILLKEHENLEFFIAGTGKDEHKVRQTIRTLQIDNKVKLCGFVEDMNTFYRSIDIYLHSVHFEGLGTSILQAMANSIPVIATDTGGITEIIRDGETGYLAGKHDPSGIAGKVSYLLNNPDTMGTVASNGRQKVLRDFSSETMVSAYMELYKKLIC